MISREDKELWGRITSNITPLGGHTGDKYPSAPLHAFNWPKAPHVACLDLHGLTLVEAHAAAARFIKQARSVKIKKVTIVTGQSGPIRGEFPAWMAAMKLKFVILPNNGSADVTIGDA